MDSDDALFEKLIAGDLRAFDRLYERFERPLFGFIRAQLGDAGEAEDVLHEAFMAVLRERETRREVKSFRAWIFQVARNLCLNRVRSRKRAGRAAEAVGWMRASGEAPLLAEQVLERRQSGEALRRAVERLPPGLAEVYRLRAGGMSYEEVAVTLGIAEGTVKSRMHEMVKRLREEVLQ
ncbi:MAG: RNA polymerase sigma factor [Myxococcales bacterium]|nr:RNA polymerase sigma factor [Myxococcales bacterium]